MRNAENNNNPRLHQKLVAEFFSGIGLMRLGLERAGWSIVFANDIDPKKMDMYHEHFGEDEGSSFTEDIHSLSINAIPTVDLATASFPCNDLSVAGGRNGLAGRHSSAFWGFLKLIQGLNERRPPIILLENVPGFLTSHGGSDFRKAMIALNELGYSVDPLMLDAVRFVPQSRLRLFVVCLREKDDEKQVPLIFSESILRPKALSNFVFANPDIKWRIRNLPSPPVRPKKSLTEILEQVPQYAPEWWSHERSTYLLNQMSAKHRSIADQMIEAEKWSYGTVFRRIRNGKSMAELRVDGVAGCLRTPRGGSGRQILFKAGFGKYFARLLTPRECARLMGADKFFIGANQNQALFGFGDAVCVPVIQWIAQNYLDFLITELKREVPSTDHGQEKFARA